MNWLFYKFLMPLHTALTIPAAAHVRAPARWSAGGPRRVGEQCLEEENAWMSKEDMAPAWAVSLLTLAAVATLLGLAILG